MKIEYNFIFKIVVTLILAVILVIALNNFETGVKTDLMQVTDADQIEENLIDTLIACYAVEGAYPADVKYVKKYGFVFDDEKYIYEYKVNKSYELPSVDVKLR